jgi:hypothetical protein
MKGFIGRSAQLSIVPHLPSLKGSSSINQRTSSLKLFGGVAGALSYTIPYNGVDSSRTHLDLNPTFAWYDKLARIEKALAWATYEADVTRDGVIIRSKQYRGKLHSSIGNRLG